MQIKKEDITFDEGLALLAHRSGGTSDNMNDWTTPGVYTKFNPANGPVQNWVVCLVVCIDTNTSFAQQLCFAEENVYYRSQNDGNWTNWRQVSIS